MGKSRQNSNHFIEERKKDGWGEGQGIFGQNPETVAK